MLRYNVRSIRLMDIVSDIKRQKLIMSPYFQRKLVWRITHKVDFIETILLGYPFPEIFIAEGDLDIEEMISRDCVVDGQQRLNSIIEFTQDKYPVNGKLYSELDDTKKEEFLKYEIAIIDLDLKHDDPMIKEIFMRLNRTFYSLTHIEKLSTEYSPSEFMLFAKLISGELKTRDELLNDSREFGDEAAEILPLEIDPGIPKEFFDWSRKVKVEKIVQLITETPVFSPYEISRQVHLMFSLNIIGSITDGLFNRNVRKDVLERYAQSFGLKDEIISKLEMVADMILKLKLRKNSYWYNKTNLFTLIIVFYRNLDWLKHVPEQEIKKNLLEFENNVPEDYKLAAKEGVNNLKERTIRDRHVQSIVDKIINGTISETS